MRKQSAALAAALFTVFSVAATDVNAQSPRVPVAPGQGAPGPRAPQPGEGITPLILSPGITLSISPDRQLVLDRPAVIIPQGRVIVREGGILILPQGGQILLGPDTPPLPLPPGLTIVTAPQPGVQAAPQAPSQAVPAPQPHAAIPSAPSAPPPEAAASGPVCGVSQAMHDGLAREGEEPLVAGVIKVERNKEGLFVLYGARQSGSWTIVTTERKGEALESCIMMSGDGLKVMPESSRGWGIPVSFTPTAAGEGEEEAPLTLKELEYKLGWKYMQSLQLTADSDQGQIRIYANTGSSTFTIVRVEDETAVILSQGIDFKGPETLHELDAAARARYQSPAPQSAPAAVPAPQ